MGQFMTDSLNALAADAGALLTMPFVLTECISEYEPDAGLIPTIKVCGTFFSAEEAQKIPQDDVDFLMQQFVLAVTGEDCQPFMAGTSVRAQIDSEQASQRCLQGSYSAQCALPLVPAPPPAPPPPTPITMTHICDASTAHVPYLLTPITVTPGLDQDNQTAVVMCVGAKAQACDKRKMCCNMDFSKIEVLMNDACRSSLRLITIDGAQVAISWGFYKFGPAFKFTNLVRQTPNPETASYCWVVRDGPCADPRQFCYNGRCQLNVFSTNNDCCPANLVA
ncbi:hypothetical protein HYH03_012681 [Edaphochlamys debaryana]|uniref:Pherophorin domain-containing protein n=1 Tax=Edaphochlamys debaryana TaxID=47281 RepID=A0A836BTT2_9CHLO|nr:hypothetical protein HYH03_012681 [Edaphochlamys debaryana]|eukprot:KAG2488680.1 hypothetical protein HYH03_012681 [Edaphochlamys debaryana]